MLDDVVHRRDLKKTVGQLLRHMSGKPAHDGVDGALSTLRARSTPGPRPECPYRVSSGARVSVCADDREMEDSVSNGCRRSCGRSAARDTALRAFHVGGTNGKGSVCATLDALLRAPGRRIGVYSSPHLIDFRERIPSTGRRSPRTRSSTGSTTVAHRGVASRDVLRGDDGHGVRDVRGRGCRHCRH